MELTQFDWLRIRAALHCAAQDLADVNPDLEAQYIGTYHAVKSGITDLYSNGLGWQPINTTTTTTGNAI